MNELPVTIGYNKGFGIVMLVCSVFILGVAFLTGQLFPQAITGGILLLVSLGYMTQPAVVIAPKEVQMKNLLGMTMRTHPFENLSDLAVENGQLMVKGTPVRVARWATASADWANLETLLSSREK